MEVEISGPKPASPQPSQPNGRSTGRGGRRSHPHTHSPKNRSSRGNVARPRSNTHGHKGPVIVEERVLRKEERLQLKRVRRCSFLPSSVDGAQAIPVAELIDGVTQQRVLPAIGLKTVWRESETEDEEDIDESFKWDDTDIAPPRMQLGGSVPLAFKGNQHRRPP